MSYDDIDPRQAHELLSGDPPHAYLDVRTVEEFAAGHAPGAWNVPIAHFGAGGMTPNPDFVAVVQAHFATDARIVVGCKMGGRSARACEVLAAAGFTALKNVDGGFGGRPDGANEAIQAGWQRCGLPVTDEADGRDYESLDRARR